MSIRTLEWLLRAKLQGGLQAVRDQPALIDLIFEDLSANSRTQLKKYLLEHDVSILLSWPRDTPSLPCWTIQMAGETPARLPIGTIIDTYRNAYDDVQEEKGEFVRKAYQIHTLAENPDVCLALSTILQHILKGMRQDLANAGFYEMQMASQDVLDLRQDFLPLFIYARVTGMTVMAEDTYVKIDEGATSVVVGPAAGMDPDGFIQVDFPT